MNGTHESVKIGVIGGSGVGTLLEGVSVGRAGLHDVHTPFGRPSGTIVEGDLQGVGVLLLSRHGAGHLLNPSAVPHRANLFALKALGCTHVIATGAVGSLRHEFRPRDLVIPDQTIDRTRGREKTFYERAAVHVEFADPFCPVLRRLLLASASADSGTGATTTHDGGCYVCMEGPAFSTRAESHLHRLMGGDLIGMTLLPEARLAREAELPYAAVCLVTDYDGWRASTRDSAALADHQTLLGEIIANLQAASDAAIGLVRRTIGAVASDPSALSSCRASDALKLAIWSDKSSIAREEIDRLGVLWGRYFDDSTPHLTPGG